MKSLSCEPFSLKISDMVSQSVKEIDVDLLWLKLGVGFRLLPSSTHPHSGPRSTFQNPSCFTEHRLKITRLDDF